MMTAPKTGREQMHSQRVNEIDLLRFIAALSVVIFHYAFRGYAADGMSSMPYPLLAAEARYGYLGVDLFFMISGFVIFMSAINVTLQDFVISRIARLYPAFWVCCTLTFLAILTIDDSRYSATFSRYLVNMTMLSGFVSVPSLDGAYWSLFVELRFYVLVAMMLALKQSHRAKLLLMLWLVASIALEAWPVGRLKTYLITDYSAYFIAGAVYYFIRIEGISFAKLSMLVASWLLAIHNALAVLPERDRYYSVHHAETVVAAIVTVFFVVLFLVSVRRTSIVGTTNWVFIGTLTYPLYLIHQNVGFMIFNKAYPVVDAHLLFWATVALMLAVAYAVHRFAERKLSRLLRRELGLLLHAEKSTKPAPNCMN